MTYDDTGVDWDLLIEAVAKEELATLDVATYTHRVIQQLSAQKGQIPTITSMARVVHRRLGKEGYDRSIGRIMEWYRVAVWVADNNGGEIEWAEGRNFSAHQRAQRRGWTWLKLVFEAPPSTEQGYETGKKSGLQLVKIGLSKLMHGVALVKVDTKYAHGYERHQMNEINDLLAPVSDVAEEVQKILDTL